MNNKVGVVLYQRKGKNCLVIIVCYRNWFPGDHEIGDRIDNNRPELFLWSFIGATDRRFLSHHMHF